MKYTLEIQKRLLQVENGNLSPHEKALLLKEAIRIADENDDPQWAVEMRLDLIYELNLLSQAEEEIAVFSRILDDYENNKDLISEILMNNDFICLQVAAFDVPEVSQSQIDAILEDFKIRTLRNGYSARAYYHLLFLHYNRMRQYDLAKEYADKMLSEKLDDMICEACELNLLLDYYLETGGVVS